MTEEPQTFAQFWPYYLSQHADPRCRAWHFVGTSLAMGFIVAAIALHPVWLIGAPVIGYGFAWIGHFGFEKNKPASWHSARHLVWSLFGDFRMWWLTLTGRIGAELRRE